MKNILILNVRDNWLRGKKNKLNDTRHIFGYESIQSFIKANFLCGFRHRRSLISCDAEKNWVVGGSDGEINTVER